MILKKFKISFLFLIALLLFLSFGDFCHAQLVDYKSMIDQETAMAHNAGFDTQSDPELQLTFVISKAITMFLSFLGIIFLILMLYGGYNWMTAAGDESKVETAKKTIQRAIIGLIIIISAYAITYSVFKVLE